MLRPLRYFLRAKAPSPVQATAALRRAFALIFALQTLLALVLGGGMGLLGVGRGGALMGAALLVMALALLPIALLLVLRAAPGRQGALSGAILAGVLLSTPAWFAGFALALRLGAPYVAALLALLLAYGALGLSLCGRLALRSLEPSAARDTTP